MNIFESLYNNLGVTVTRNDSKISNFHNFIFDRFLHSIYASGALISTVTDVGPAGVVGERSMADLKEVAEWPLLALEPLRDPAIVIIRLEYKIK